MDAEPLYFSLKGQEIDLDPSNSPGLVGAKMLAFQPMPVQYQMFTLLEATNDSALPLYENNVFEVPRRAGKTDGIFSEAVGRCMSRMDYEITYCAQSGVKSRDRFYSLMKRLRRHYPVGWKSRESRGEEQLEFVTGSVLRFRPPKASSFRGDAIDWVILDEAQEVDDEDAADLLGSLLPIFDTREDAQLTVSGTAGASRSGLLWEQLEKGRAGLWGILEYAMPETMDPLNPNNWLKVHPGPAGVSKERAQAVLQKRFDEMSEDMFKREYLGIWPLGKSVGAFARNIWERLGREMPERPKRFGLAFDVTPSGSSTAVLAVWRDSDGKAWAEVIHEANGTKWAPDFIGGIATKYRLPVGFDTAGVDTLAVADVIARKYPRVELKGLTTIEFATACATVNADILSDNFRHVRQPALTDAVMNASRRPIRDMGWAWGRKQSSGSIAPLVAATVGLKIYDDLPQERILTVLRAKSS